MNKSTINVPSAGTEDHNSTTAQNYFVSQPNANTNVVGSFYDFKIEFRGWSERTNYWVYGDLNQHDIHNGISIIENGVIIHKVVPESVGQYTGMLDLRGVKLFTGDFLIRSINFPKNESPKNYNEIIIATQGGFKTMDLSDKSKSPCWMGNFQYHTIKKVGTYFENPECFPDSK